MPVFAVRGLSVLMVVLVLVAGCGGGGGGAAGGSVPASAPTRYVITYTAVPVNTTNLYINGERVSNGEQFNRYYTAGSNLVFTFDDQCDYQGKTYQADTYRIDYYNQTGTPMPVQPGGVTVILTRDTSVLITYTEMPPTPLK